VNATMTELTAIKEALRRLKESKELRELHGVDANTVWMTEQVVPASVQFSFTLPPTIKRALGLVVGSIALEKEDKETHETLMRLKRLLRATCWCHRCDIPCDHANSREVRPLGEFEAEMFPNLSPGMLVPVGVCVECGDSVYPL